MQRAGRDDEARRIGDGVGAGRQVSAVGVAVADRERTDDRCGDPERRPRSECHHHAENCGRHRDADLDAGQRHTEDAEHAAERHHQRKHHRQDEDRGRAEKRAPQPDRHHRHRVVEAKQRMRQTAGEAAAHAATVGQHGRHGTEANQNREKADYRWPHAGHYSRPKSLQHRGTKCPSP